MTYYPRLASDLGRQYDVLVSEPWRVRLYGLCVAECPRRHDAPLADYGAAGTEWPVPASTTAVLNRCVPLAEHNETRTAACAEPRCDSAAAVALGATCLRLAGYEERGLWAARTAELALRRNVRPALNARESL